MASNLRVDSIVPSTSGNVSIGTATGGVTIPGDLGIAGVLTYEDVTNVDSIGVITARSGINGPSVLSIKTGGTERLHITSSGVKQIKNGNLNILSTYIDFSGSISTPSTAAAIYRPVDNTLAFSTANTEKLRIKSDGKVNITPGGSLSGSHPPGDLNIVGTNFLTMTPNDNANASDNEVLGVVAFLPYAAGSIAAASAKIEAVAESGQSGSSNATSLRFYNKNSSTGPGNSGIERMRITSNANGTGALYINQTSEVSGANSHLVVNNSVAIVSGSTFRSFYMSGNGNAYFWNGSNQPYISSGGNFTNASDISLKKDITDLTYGIDVLKNLKPRKYKMKLDDKEQIGFIAQEVESFIPEVVDIGETPDGTEHKGLAYGNLTAVLTKALQEAVTKIETLEAKVAALEGS